MTSAHNLFYLFQFAHPHIYSTAHPILYLSILIYAFQICTFTNLHILIFFTASLNASAISFPGHMRIEPGRQHLLIQETHYQWAVQDAGA